MNTKYYLMIAAACVALAGCQAGSGKPDEGGPAAAGEQSPPEKDRYLAAVKSKMKDMDAKINDLAEKSRSLKDDAKASAGQALAALREERAVLGQKYEDLKKSSAAAWDSAKTGFGKAWDDMQSSLETAKSKFD